MTLYDSSINLFIKSSNKKYITIFGFQYLVLYMRPQGAHFKISLGLKDCYSV